MTHNHEDDCTESKDYKRIRDHYRWLFPLLAAYQDVISERNVHKGSINEPPTEPCGISTEQATQIALQRIGRPARDRQDIAMADAYVHRLWQELDSFMPEQKLGIADFVIARLYPLGEFVPSVEDWDAMDADEKDFVLDEIADVLPDHADMIKETLTYAMPGILAEITRQDQHHQDETLAAQEDLARRIRESDIALVRERNQIDDVIGEYVALRQVGEGTVKGLCPFHDEKTPSFNVRPTHGTFHCFGCGEGGDVIAFLTKIDHLSFVEAVERLAERAGIKLTYEDGGISVQRDCVELATEGHNI
jgi:hypothetical protein